MPACSSVCIPALFTSGLGSPTPTTTYRNSWRCGCFDIAVPSSCRIEPGIVVCMPAIVINTWGQTPITTLRNKLGMSATSRSYGKALWGGSWSLSMLPTAEARTLHSAIAWVTRWWRGLSYHARGVAALQQVAYSSVCPCCCCTASSGIQEISKQHGLPQQRAIC